MKNMIEVTELHRALPQGERMLHILRGVSFTVAPQEWVAITGPSGSGKSTLLGLLAGIDTPTSGHVTVNGIAISELPEGRLARIRNEQIGIVFQSFHLIPAMTALENVEAPLYISPKRRQARAIARQMLDQVGLADRMNHLPHQLSGGEQQRVAIARALAAGPRLLLADEPTGNLDSATSRQVLNLLQELRQQFGLTIVMVTHDPAVAERAGRRLHLVDGKFTGAESPPVALAGRGESAAAAGVGAAG